MPEGSVVSWLLLRRLHRPKAKVGQTGNHRPVSTISDSPRGTKQANTRPSLEAHARSTPPRPPVIYRTSDYAYLPPYFSLSRRAPCTARRAVLAVTDTAHAECTKTNKNK